ncbi:hypothetical protein L596_003117 [Steinernema carpocapsae]|uniref:Uncharacterized protein n=1 Tax=Steinernema carpocapsae TaxID=34508 RepID=A0A4U8UT53_STECR|nr:hypothetical protein L596_003117 [Steinernema carpocapsae]
MESLLSNPDIYSRTPSKALQLRNICAVLNISRKPQIALEKPRGGVVPIAIPTEVRAAASFFCVPNEGFPQWVCHGDICLGPTAETFSGTFPPRSQTPTKARGIVGVAVLSQVASRRDQF